MSLSKDAIAERVIDEIVIEGNEGITIAETSNLIHRFKLEVSTSDPQLQEDIGSLAELYHAVDFEQSVWQELVIHPELLGLDSLREQGSRCSEPLLNDLLSVHPLAAYVLTAPRHADLVSRSSLRILNSDTNDHMPEASKWITDLRIAATEARVWMTVAGHEPSYVRIPRLKFDILKILLKHGPAGLLQPELVQISGQDKRSLPRRTTELAQLGYLIKRPANKHGLKTSRLLHKRYSPEAAPITHQSTSDQDPKSFKDIDWAVVDREFLIDQVLKLLKSRRIIQRDDLKAEMGVASDRWKRKLLWRIIYHLMSFGCLADVNAPAANEGGKIFRCVKFLRDPSRDEVQAVVAGKNMDEVEQDLGPADEDDEIVETEKIVNDLDWNVADWDRTRPLPNLISDLVASTGPLGMEIQDFGRYTHSRLIDRAFESLLVRSCSYRPTASKDHPFRRGLVREVAIKNKVHFYQYYTEEEYDKLVSIGDRDWPDIVPSLSNITGVITPVQTDGKLASLDENGFIPIPDVLLNQSTGPTDAASLADSVEITKDDITHPAIAYYMTCRSTDPLRPNPVKAMRQSQAPDGGRVYPKGEEPYKSEVRKRWKAQGREVPKYVPKTKIGKRRQSKTAIEARKRMKLTNSATHCSASATSSREIDADESDKLVEMADDLDIPPSDSDAEPRRAGSTNTIQPPLPVETNPADEPTGCAEPNSSSGAAEGNSTVGFHQSPAISALETSPEPRETLSVAATDCRTSDQLDEWRSMLPKNHLRERKLDFLQFFLKCNSILPGGREGANVWRDARACHLQASPSAEIRSLENIVNSLIEGGFIACHTFSFFTKSKKGVDKKADKKVLTLPAVLFLSPDVQSFKEKMIEKHPWTYVPPEADLDRWRQDSRLTRSGPMTNTSMEDLVHRTSLNRKRRSIQPKAKMHATLQFSRPELHTKHLASGTFGTFFAGISGLPYEDQLESTMMKIPDSDMLKWVLSKRRGRPIDFTKKGNPPYEEFMSALTTVENWELDEKESAAYAKQRFSETRFLNHHLPEAAFKAPSPENNEYRFVEDPLEDFSESSEVHELDNIRRRGPRGSRVASARTRQRPARLVDPSEISVSRSTAPGRAVPRGASHVEGESEIEGPFTGLHNWETKRNLTKPRDHEGQVPVPYRFHTDDGSQAVRYRARADDGYFSKTDERRLMVGVVVVRTLLGGLDRAIDWGLIASIFPRFPHDFIRKRYQRARADVKKYSAGLFQGFPDFFLEAYEKGEVDALDYDSVETYDWDKLIDYTISKMSIQDFRVSPTTIKEMPASIEEFEEQYVVTAEEGGKEWRAKAHGKVFDSFLQRSATLGARPYVSEKEAVPNDITNKRNEALTHAESVIKATILTNPDKRIDDVAAKKINELDPEISIKALQSLTDKKLILKHRSYGQNERASGLNYDFTAEMFVNLNQGLASQDFAEASRFQQKLDKTLKSASAEKTSMDLTSMVLNGDAMVLLNLVAQDKITLGQRNLPYTRMGMVPASEAKRLDPKLVRFDLSVSARTPREMSGPVGSVLTPISDESVLQQPLTQDHTPPVARPSPTPSDLPPQDHFTDPTLPIPAWYDIHGHLHWAMWSKHVGCILSILIERSGATVQSICEFCIESMTRHDALQILKWLGLRGYARPVEECVAAKMDPEKFGWELCGDWWRALDAAEEALAKEQGESEGKGKGKAMVPVGAKQVAKQKRKRGRKSYAELTGSSRMRPEQASQSGKK